MKPNKLSSGLSLTDTTEMQNQILLMALRGMKDDMTFIPNFMKLRAKLLQTDPTLYPKLIFLNLHHYQNLMSLPIALSFVRSQGGICWGLFVTIVETAH
jgi:hypothetical protein